MYLAMINWDYLGHLKTNVIGHALLILGLLVEFVGTDGKSWNSPG